MLSTPAILSSLAILYIVKPYETTDTVAIESSLQTSQNSPVMVSVLIWLEALCKNWSAFDAN